MEFTRELEVLCRVVRPEHISESGMFFPGRRYGMVSLVRVTEMTWNALSRVANVALDVLSGAEKWHEKFCLR